MVYRERLCKQLPEQSVDLMDKGMLKDQVILQIDQALDRMAEIADRPPVRLEYARDEKFGDYACTVAMDKDFRTVYSIQNPEYKTPRKFAESLRAELSQAVPAFFESIEIAGPGFINLRVAAAVLRSQTQRARLLLSDYGKSEKKNPRKIIFEFVSANPTGPLNIVSARAAALGDSCCNLMEATGDEVFREFYVNDYGNQVDLLGISCLVRLLEIDGFILRFVRRDADGKFVQKADQYEYTDAPGLCFPAGGYHGQYIIDATKFVSAQHAELKPDSNQIIELKKISDSQVYDSDAKYIEIVGLSSLASRLGTLVLEYFQASQRTDLERFRVKFNNFYKESQLHDAGAVLKVRQKLKKYIFEKKGKEFFQSTAFGDDKDRVIVRDDGRPTYLLADIAYHADKMARGFDKIYNIWGPDHHGYIARLSGAMQAMGYPDDSFDVLIAQQVRLLNQGEEIRMSKRAGQMVTMAELLDDIPVDVVRYYFVMRSFESHLDFDLAEARDTSDKNPYYYVGYAHARICNIIKRVAEDRNIDISGDATQSIDFELTTERRRLLWLVARFPEEVVEAAASLEPHRLVGYLYQLAQALARFYSRRENRVLEQDDANAKALLAMLDAVAITLRNGLSLLGMQAPEKM